MKRLCKSFILACSYYTKIPMPSLSYGAHDGDYLFCFFPVIGFLIAAAELLWQAAARILSAGDFLTPAIAVAIPVLITGGIHLDGLLDASDAIASWKPREERLKILHDTHTGAFAVITCVIYLLQAYGAAAELSRNGVPQLVWLIFPSARLFTALLVVLEPPAGTSGMLYTCTKDAAIRAVVISSMIYAALLTGLAMLLGLLLPWLILLLVGLVVLLCYHRYIRRVFGGITGDLAGCFLSVYELVLLIAAALIHI